MSEEAKLEPLSLEVVSLDSLSSHPRNYRKHPDDELEHLAESIRTNGVYRNIVVARDGTILAGHGVVEAARRAGLEQVPVRRLDIAPEEPRALKVLAGDNEIGRLSEVDDRALSELLKEVKDDDLDGLLGTGYDERMLANLVYVTRPESEIPDRQEAAHWAGMPEYDNGEDAIRVTVNFLSEEDRKEFAARLGIELSGNGRGRSSSLWWPPKAKDDLESLRFSGAAE